MYWIIRIIIGAFLISFIILVVEICKYYRYSEKEMLDSIKDSLNPLKDE